MFKVGNRVWSIIQGWGVVLNSNMGTDNYPTVVLFSSKLKQTYTEDGRYRSTDKFPELFNKKQELTNFVRKIDWTKVPMDTKMLVDNVHVRYFICKLDNDEALCFSDGDTSKNSQGDTTSWDNYKMHPDVKIQEEWYGD